MKTVIFDVDGTIFDTKPGIIGCLNDVLNSYGYGQIRKENEDRYIGPSIKDSLMNLNGFSEALAAEATQLYREKYVKEYVVDSIPYAGLFDLLHFLKAKHCCICIATMKTRPQVDRLLEIFSIIDFFDYVETANEHGGYLKSDMLETIKSNCHDNDELIFVGDTRGDYLASKKANIPFIFAKYGYGTVDDAACKSISQLSDLTRIWETVFLDGRL